MEHRGIKYALVHTTTPEGWRWSVKQGNNEASGVCADRLTATTLARQAIDRQLAMAADWKVSEPQASRASHFS